MMTQQLNVGDIVANGFEVISVLGDSPLGTSYIMSDTSTHEKFFVKQLSFECDDARCDEIRKICSSIRNIVHKSMASFKDFIVDGTTGYVLMEFIDGDMLETHLQQRRERGQILGIKAAYSFLAHICLGIEVLHAASFCYGCLSPKMIFVTREGRVRIANYALSCLADRFLDDDARNQFFGDKFCAPEVRSQRACAQTQSDVYSLSLIFAELLSGSSYTDFDGTPSAFIARLSGVASNVKEALIKGTSDAFGERFPNTQEFKEMLKNAVDAPNDKDISSIVVGVNDLRALMVGTEHSSGEQPAARKPDLFDSGYNRPAARTLKADVWIYQKDGMDFGPFDHKGLIQKFYDDVITESTSVFNTSTKKRQNLGSIEEFKKEVTEYLPIRAHNHAVRDAEEKKKSRQRTAGGVGVGLIIVGIVGAIVLIPLIYLWNLVEPEPVGFADAIPVFDKKFEAPKMEAVSLNMDDAKAQALFDPNATEAEREAAFKAWEEEHRKKYAGKRAGAKKPGGAPGEEIDRIVFTGDDGQELEPLLDWEISEKTTSPTMYRRIRACADKHAGGRRLDVSVSFTIKQTGMVSGVSTTASGELNSCLTSAFQSLRFRQFGGTTKKVTQPINI